MKSYNGKILEVDLTKKKFNELFIKEEVYKNYIGGSGLAAKLLFDNYDFKDKTLSAKNLLSSKSELSSKDLISPNYALSPENLLIFMTGPLTATRLPGCATRFSVCSISPLTGIWGEASCGGSFGIQLKKAGFDGIVIKGASDSPVFIKIVDGNVEIKDALNLWNKDTYEVYDILKKEEGVTTSVSIGIAGENKVLFANIANEPGNYAGRCGLGAVMGSKNLKAIGVKGTGNIEFADSVKINELRKELIEKQKKNIALETLKAFGTDGAMTFYMMLGDVPIKNWNLGLWDEGGDALSGMAMAESILVKGRTCLGCPVACKRVVKVDEEKYKMNEGPGPEYETCSSFGTLCFNSNLKAVANFKKLKDDLEIGPKVFALNLIIKFIYHNPEAVIFIHSPNKEIIQGDREDVKPDVKMEMNADVAHRFWLGKVNLMVALTKGDIKAKGPIPKIMKLLPIIRSAYAIYKDYLKEEGFEELVNVE